MISRILGALLLIAVGLLIGTLGAFVQAARWVGEVPWGVIVVPWGIVVVWIALIAAIRGGTWLIRTRWGSWAVLLGWLAATLIFATESPSGDLALSGGGRQMTYLLGGVILGSAAATFPLPRSAKGAQAPRHGNG